MWVNQKGVLQKSNTPKIQSAILSLLPYASVNWIRFKGLEITLLSRLAPPQKFIKLLHLSF
jgi:hypothetical protein